MRLRSSHFSILLSAMFLAACATVTPPHTELPVAARDGISSTDVVVPVRQGEIYVFVPDSQVAAAAGGGLLWALVDAGVNSVRTSKAEAAVKPLRDAMVDFDFSQVLQDKLKTSLSQIPWLHAGNVTISKDTTAAGMDGALANSKASAVLFAVTDYHLSNDGAVLSIVVNASLFGNNDALNALAQSKTKSPKTALGNSIYRNVFTFEETLPGSSDDRDRNIAAWDAQGSSAMRSALKLGAMKLSMMLVADLQGPGEGGGLGDDADGVVMHSSDGTLKFVAKPTL